MPSSISPALRDLVRARARHRREYCRIATQLDFCQFFGVCRAMSGRIARLSAPPVFLEYRWEDGVVFKFDGWPKKSLKNAHKCPSKIGRSRAQAYRSPFPVDHIRARQHGGTSSADDLALACLHCNAHKGPNLSGVEPMGGSVHWLFDPRTHRWSDHFAWSGPLIVGLTATGRATIAVLAMNASDAVTVRRSLIEEGDFPPAEPSP